MVLCPILELLISLWLDLKREAKTHTETSKLFFPKYSIKIV